MATKQGTQPALHILRYSMCTIPVMHIFKLKLTENNFKGLDLQGTLVQNRHTNLAIDLPIISIVSALRSKHGLKLEINEIWGTDNRIRKGMFPCILNVGRLVGVWQEMFNSHYSC